MDRMVIKENHNFFDKLKKINIVFTDIDGVWTDGGMYYDENGNEIKKFNTRDGMGVERLRKIGLQTIVCTSENTSIVNHRAKKLEIEQCFIGVKDKKKLLELYCKENETSPETIAYIGDDMNDIEIMKLVGFSACPKDAFKNVLNTVDYICNTDGGMGAFREFAELIIEVKNEKTK